MKWARSYALLVLVVSACLTGCDAVRLNAPASASPPDSELPIVGPSGVGEGVPNRFTNSAGMSMVLVRAGEFLMGSPVGQGEDDEPEHRVRLTRAFYLCAHETTLAQYRQYAAETGAPTSCDVREGLRRSWAEPGFPQGEDHPVVNVRWSDALAFCHWLSLREGRSYRLPTEAEWEYACRASSRTRFSSGDGDLALADLANISDSEPRRIEKVFELWGDGFTNTSPVGRFQPNGFGLYDMHGNVWEWCSDWYNPAYYRASPRQDPHGPQSGRDRVARGGCFELFPAYARSANRAGFTPEWACCNLGFRVAMEAPLRP